MNDNEEMVDEMRLIINNKTHRRILSALLSKMVNDKIPIDLNLNVDSIVIDTLPNGRLDFRLAAKGTLNKDEIFKFLGRKGGLK